MSFLNMANKEAAILVIVGRTKCLFQLFLLKYILGHTNIHFDKRNRSHKTHVAIGEAFSSKFCQKSVSVGDKNIYSKSMVSRSMKFPYNVA